MLNLIKKLIKNSLDKDAHLQYELMFPFFEVIYSWKLEFMVGECMIQSCYLKGKDFFQNIIKCLLEVAQTELS